MSEGYVIDTSALMQIYVQDSYTQNAHALIARLVQEDEFDLHYLEIGLAESINVLWKHVKWKNIAHQAAKQAVADLQALPLIIHPIKRYLDGAFDLSVAHDLAVYDALYIVTARHLNLPLITADQKQSRIALEAGVAIKALGDFQPSE